MTDKIKSDKMLKPLFLSYIKHTVLMLELDEYYEGMGQDEMIENNHVLSSLSSSSDNLAHSLKDKYDVDLNNPDSAVLINEICKHYVDKYSYETILKMEDV